MANSNSLFQDFNTNISLTQGKKTKMKNSKNSLRERISKRLKITSTTKVK